MGPETVLDRRASMRQGLIDEEYEQDAGENENETEVIGIYDGDEEEDQAQGQGTIVKGKNKNKKQRMCGQIVRTLYAMSTLLVTFVLVRVWGQMMPGHGFFYSVAVSVGVVPVFFVLFLFRRFGQGVKASKLDASWPMIKQSLVMGFMAAVSLWAISTSTDEVEGPVQLVTSQVPLVLGYIFGSLLCCRKYGCVARMGVIFILAGTIVLFTSSSSDPVRKAGWVVLFAVGYVPCALWEAAFEGFHKAVGPDGRRSTLELRMLWTCLCLVLFLFAFIPFYALLHKPPTHGFFQDFKNTTVCVFQVGDDCKRAGWVLGLTVLAGALHVHSQILLARNDQDRGLGLALAPFLANLVFPCRSIMGPFVRHVSTSEATAAGICLAGVFAFTYSERLEQKKRLRNVLSSSLVKWLVKLD